MTYPKRVVVITSAPPSQCLPPVLYQDQILQLRNANGKTDSTGRVLGLRYLPLDFMELETHPHLTYPPSDAKHPACFVYQGGEAFTRTARALTELRVGAAMAGQKVKADWFIIDPAYGLVNANAPIWPYRWDIRDALELPPIHLMRDLADVLNPRTFSDSGDKKDGRNGLRYEYDVALVAIAPEFAPLVDVGSFWMQRAFGRAFYFCDPSEKSVQALRWVETGYRAEVPNRFESLALTLRHEVPRFLATCTYEDREYKHLGS